MPTSKPCYQVRVYTCGQWHTYRDAFGVFDLGNSKNPGLAEMLADSSIHAGADEARVIRLHDRRTVYVASTEQKENEYRS